MIIHTSLSPFCFVLSASLLCECRRKVFRSVVPKRPDVNQWPSFSDANFLCQCSCIVELN